MEEKCFKSNKKHLALKKGIIESKENDGSLNQFRVANVQQDLLYGD